MSQSPAPPTYRQLCVIAREQIQRSPTIDDFEWAERIKRRLLALGFDYPQPPQLLKQAMAAVEQALVKQLGPRPAPPAPRPPQMDWTPAQSEPPWKRTQAGSQGWVSIADLIAKITGSRDSGRSSGVRATPETKPTTLTEAQVLAAFWHEATDLGADRIEMLRKYAELAIQREAEWDPERIRAEASQHRLKAQGCFVCRAGDPVRRPLDWHHVIQVQHGGSNSARNRVALCERCHGRVHPWLPEAPLRQRQTGFASIADCIPGALKIHEDETT